MTTLLIKILLEWLCFSENSLAKHRQTLAFPCHFCSDFVISIQLLISSRQEEGLPHSSTASINNGELQPLSRTGSPTSAEKDILVCNPA